MFYWQVTERSVTFLIMKENTREEILFQTFQLLDESGYSAVSMAQIAARVGISKPAIYRHFASKEVLLTTLKTRFFDDLAACLMQLADLPENHLNDSLQHMEKYLFHMLAFFASHPQHLTFFLAAFANDSQFEGEILSAMKERGLPSRFYQESDLCSEKTLTVYLHYLYTSATAVYFINEKKHVCPKSDATAFAEKLGSFLLYGWDSLRNCPEPDYDALDKIASITISEIPEESRIFTALAQTIHTYGFSGVTIERLSSSLGMAKSSLYTYFENKNELITRLIIEEMKYLSNLLAKRIRQGTTVSEMIYIHLQTMLSYLLLRPSILPVCAWMRLRGTAVRTTMFTAFSENSFSYYEKIHMPEFGLDLNDISMSGWVSMLPISILLQCQYHNIPEIQLFQLMRKVFAFMRDGVGRQGQKPLVQNDTQREQNTAIAEFK